MNPHIIPQTLAATRSNRLGLSLNALAISLALAFGLAPDTTYAQSTTSAQINISAQSLNQALLQLGQQTDIQIYYLPETVANLNAPAVSGMLTAEQALAQLLRGTDIEVQWNGKTASLSRSASGDVTTLAPIMISGKGIGSTTEGTGSYTTWSTSSSTRLNLSLQETPQSISVLTRQRIEDQRINDIAEAVQAMPGTTKNATTSDGTDAPPLISRGATVNSFQIDGVPSASSLGNHLQSTAIFDRVEFVRGATGMMNAVGSVAGTINMIRKRPTDELQISLRAEGGNWDRYGLGADISGPLNESGSVRGRLVADFQSHGSWAENYNHKNGVLYGITEIDLSDNTLLTAGFSHVARDTDAPVGPTALLYDNGELLEFGPKDANRPKWSYYDTTLSNVFLSLEYRFNSGWSGKAEVSHTDYRRDSLYYLSGPVSHPGSGMLVSWVNRYKPVNKQNSLDAYLAGSFNLFGRQHEMIAGVTLSQTRSDVPNYSATYSSGTQFIPDVSMLDQLLKPDLIAETGKGNDRIHQYSAYISTKLNLSDATKVLLGTRLTNWKSESSGVTYSTGARTTNNQEEKGLLVPYVGIVHALDDNWSLYGSYTKIFTPNSVYTRNLDGSLLDPQEGISYEIGVKGSFFDERLNASLSLYQTNLDNMAIRVGPGADQNNYKAEDGTKTRGVELELSGELAKGWQFGGGYSFNSMKDQNGRRLQAVIPQHNFKFFTTYQLGGKLTGLTVGGGVDWYSKSQTSGVSGRAYKRDGYILANLMARYKINENMTASVNVNNVFNKKYISGFSEFYGVYGAPRNFMVNLTHKF